MSGNEWDDYADDWDGNEDVRLYAECAFSSWEEKVAPLYADMSEIRVLDFGCGTGLLTEKLATCCGQVVAVDTSEKMVAVLSQKLALSNAENIVASHVSIDTEAIRANPELFGEFDLIVASSVCSFLPDYPSTLTVLSSIMKPGAFFVQWDWMAQMPAEKIESAFEAVGLSAYAIEEAFAMEATDQSAQVIIGIGLFEGAIK